VDYPIPEGVVKIVLKGEKCKVEKHTKIEDDPIFIINITGSQKR
jgi:hypothetical protein